MAFVPVPHDDIFSSQHDPFVRHASILRQPHHRRQRKLTPHRGHEQPFGSFDQLRLPLKNEHNRPPGRTDRQRLIVLVEHEDVAVDEGRFGEGGHTFT